MTDCTLPKSLQVAPAADDVFSRPDYHARYFLPLLSFELSEVFDDLGGRLHFVDPVEPYDGCIGEYTKAFHNYYCRDNWVSFKVENGLYEFEGSEDFFSQHYWKSHTLPEHFPESVRESWLESESKFIEKRHKKYREWTHKFPDLRLEDAKLDLKLGGKPSDANWANMTDFPLSADEVSVPGQSFPTKFPYPLTENGRRFRFIGYTETFDWRCGICLFYDPTEQRALQTFEWT